MSALEVVIAIVGLLFVFLLIKMSRGGVPLDTPGDFGGDYDEDVKTGHSAGPDGGGGDGGD